MNIPDKFCKDGQEVVVRNVGELKAALNELPDDLPVRSDFARSARVVVYNVSSSPFMELQEPDEDSGDW